MGIRKSAENLQEIRPHASQFINLSMQLDKGTIRGAFPCLPITNLTIGKTFYQFAVTFGTRAFVRQIQQVPNDFRG